MNSRVRDEPWLQRIVRPGDLVVIEQGVGEPTALVEELVAGSRSLIDTEIFVGLSYSGVISRSTADELSLSSFGAMGTLAPIAEAGALSIIPCNYADVARSLNIRGSGRLVLMVQVSPVDANGYHGFGVAMDYTHELMGSARAVVAEVNDQMPNVPGPRVHGSMFAATVHTSRPLPICPTPKTSELHRRIAETVVDLIPREATIQLGIGAVPSVVGSLLTSRRDLRVHSALVGDWLLDLARAGSLRDEPGSVFIGGAAGSRDLYEFLSTSGAHLLPIPELGAPQTLASIDRLVAMNSALQVDLTGQVNAEVLGEHYVGGIGGQADFLRGAQISEGGRSIVMLPASAANGTKSRIVRRLDQGTVTTARSSVDFVVTEYGLADLRGKDLHERSKSMQSIAAPEHRDSLQL